MSRKKNSTKRKTRSKARRLGVAGVTLSLLTGASGAFAHPSLTESPDSRNTRGVVLSEEEISDVSLSTFYAVDREGQSRAPRRRLASACGCGCGCFGCAGACWSGTYYTGPVFNDGPSREPIRPVQKY